jgi:chemosensory pili system protein ChpA (sensor histidine kinase/response regulator)
MYYNPDLVTLGWCIGEIRQALEQAENHLEAFMASDRSSSDGLRQSRHALHQAHGALQVVDVPGVALLTHEAEALIGRIERAEIELNGEIQTVIAASFRAVAEYLEALLAGAELSSLSLFPYLRDLLTLRQAERIHPADLFFPDLSRRPRFASSLPVNPSIEAQSIRQQFERGLLKHLREPDSNRGAQYMTAALTMMTLWEGAQTQRQFWQLAVVFLTSLEAGQSTTDVYNKRLLARLNLQVRATLDGQPIADRLFADLLFAIACVPPGVHMVDEAKKAWQLPTITAQDYETRRFAIQDVRHRRRVQEALGQVKLGWEKISRAAQPKWTGDLPDALALTNALELLQAGLEKLKLRGMVRLVQALAETRKRFAQQPQDSLALEAASALLFMEHVMSQPAHELAQWDLRCVELAQRLQSSTDDVFASIPPWLQSFTQAAEERNTIVSFVREMQTSLKQVEAALDTHFRDHEKTDELEGAARLLRQSSGALAVLGHEEASKAALALSSQVEALMQSPGSASRFERIASSAGALGFFVESLLQPESRTTRYVFDEASGAFGVERLPAAVMDDPLFDLQADLQTVSALVEPERVVLQDPAPESGAESDLAKDTVRSQADQDQELIEIFIEEAQQVLEAIGEQADQLAGQRGAAHAEAFDALITLRRGFHTLKGSSRMVGLGAFGEAAWGLEQLLNTWLAEERAPTLALIGIVRQAQAKFVDWVQAIAQDPTTILGFTEIHVQATRLQQGDAAVEWIEEPAPQAEDLDAEPPHAALDAAVQALDESVQHVTAEAFLDSGVSLPVELNHRLAVQASDPPQTVEAERTDEVAIGERWVSRALFDIFLAEADDRLHAMRAALEPDQVPDTQIIDPAVRAAHSLAGAGALVGLGPVRSLSLALETAFGTWLQHLEVLGDQPKAELAQVVDALAGMLHRFAAGSEPVLDELVTVSLANLQSAMQSQIAASMPVPEVAPAGDHGLSEPELHDEVDAELCEIFFAEAQDVLPAVGEQLRLWMRQPADLEVGHAVMRGLHTVKGGARMAGAMRFGQRVHEMETAVEDLLAQGGAEQSILEALWVDYDRIMADFEQLAMGGQEPPKGSQEAHASAQPVVAPGAAPAVAPVMETAAAPVAGVPQPLLRVRADIIDRIVNEAGEVSIARSRLDNELNNLRGALAELTENVHRLRSQLRDIEIQAESQIEAQLAQHRDQDRSFDPLEFDRYTRFQELTRMLAESVNDVATVQQNAHRNLEAAGADLKRQGQSMRELQQHLMRIRMVQFGSISDRLYRVVRQASKDAGKRVNLDLVGAAAEIDRNVLEAMIAPIEHLLRNAVAHGIEARELRLAAGKAEVGGVHLKVEQQGQEVVLQVADDGGGLNMARIREKAIEQGLIRSDANLSDAETAQLIFAPGFSTASQVDELSGRGVGMDVVRNTVAELGGRIEISSKPGKGTAFVVRLPLTLAVTQVMLVSAATQRFALNTSAVEQVLQMKPGQLADAHRDGHLVLDEVRVPLHYLGHLCIGEEATPAVQHLSPVLIVQVAGERMALHADAMSKTQEVVIKPVGPQIAGVPGIVGATILGDGEIVLILNPVQMARLMGPSNLSQHADAMVRAAAASLPPTVMVVDDSVTVRKVTQRLLQREGYEVMLAKDGLDALRQLEERQPEVMLLDIEMPRMDGFDLTRNLRADPRFLHLPIIMISSRTGEKHRGIAESIGVNHFLGKPYDEDSLLHLIDRFVKQGRGQPQGSAPVLTTA